ncbi:MAG TPA: hypothetical protein PKB01_08630 [Xanthobacteraceae bacterium]|nr:hypothetical protein [Xanthobacteraceae bacterium]
MSPALNVHRTGLTLATFVGSIHLLWSAVVALGFGQEAANFVLRLHFVKPVYSINPFQIDTAALLVALTVAVSYCLGAFFALIWNRVQR